MKKFIVFAIIGWMSVLAVNAQWVAFHGGYGFSAKNGVYRDRLDFAVDYMEKHGVAGIGTKIPSSHDRRFEVNAYGGWAWYWGEFGVSPQVEIAFNTAGSAPTEESAYKPNAGLSIGAGLMANYKIVGPLGAYMKVRWMSPVAFDPLKVGPGGNTSFTIGLSMFWWTQAKKK